MNKLSAQTSILGPDCIIPGTSYQYLVSGNWGANASVKVCVVGGVLSSGGTCTTPGTIPTMVFVIWNDSSSNRRIELTTNAGNASLQVKGTTPLNAGQILAQDITQGYDKNKNLFVFHCADAKGGSCSPTYMYQWQRSDNALNWTNLDGENKKDLKFTGTVIVNTYFRRVTTEMRSNTIGYSDNAILVVQF